MEKKSGLEKFLLLWTGELVSSIGGGLTSFGLGVYVFRQTGSAASMALVTLLAFLPTLVLSVPAGVLADRYDRRILMMLGDGLSGLGILYILLRILTGGAGMADICLGVTVSAVFSSLLEPSYRATVTDLLTAEEYSKASGLVSLAGSARYLISPMLAGALLTVSDIRLLLAIDILTFVLTVTATGVVRKGLRAKPPERQEPFPAAVRAGWRAVTGKRGVFLLIIVSTLVTCFMGAMQILAEPLILAFRDSAALGAAETVCASGMLVSSLYLGVRGIKKGYVRVLAVSLALAGAGMAVFGLREDMVLICCAGFFFFATLPFANSCLDYLTRTNISGELQGRAWGFIGFLSQMGYVVAYSICGVLADRIGSGFGIGVGRGAAWVIILSGILLVVTAALVVALPSIRALEKGGIGHEETAHME